MPRITQAERIRRIRNLEAGRPMLGYLGPRRGLGSGARRRFRRHIQSTVNPGFTRTGGNFGRFQSGGGPERKWLDTTMLESDIPNTGVILTGGGGGTDQASINAIAQGDGPSERDGRKVVIKSVQARGQVTLNSGPGLISYARIRMILYLDKQANGAAATVTDILETANINSHLNLSNNLRFTILWDKVIDLNSTGNVVSTTGSDTYGNAVRSFKFYKKVNIPVEFDGTTAAIANIKSNNLNFLFISYENGLPESDIFGTARVRYTDI